MSVLNTRGDIPQIYCNRRSWLKYSFGFGLVSLFSEIPGHTYASETNEVADGVYVHSGRHELFSPSNKGDISNLGFIVGKNGVAVIDTGGSPLIGQKMKDVISSVTKAPITYVINTHMHPDHIFGNVIFENQDTVFVGHHKLVRALAARADHYLAINKDLLGPSVFEGTKIIYPSLQVQDTMTLDLGERRLELQAHPTAHTDNDLTITDSKTGITFMGDLIFSQHVPALDGSIKGWISVLDSFTVSPPQRIVPGHGPAVMTWSEAAPPMKRYLTKIAEDVRAYLRSGKTLSEALEGVGISEKDKWELFESYHKRNVSAAFAELEWE